MKSLPPLTPSPGVRRRAAFTLVETLFAVGIGTIVLAMTGTFITMAVRSTSGIVAQTMFNTQAGRTSELMFNRIRFATSLTNNAAGDTLTMGFDDDFQVDSDGDGKTYDDRNHYEIFQFTQGQLLYYSMTTNSIFGTTNVLIKSSANTSVTNVPNQSFFAVTNATTTVIVNYLLVDRYASDGYQSCAIQTMFLARNRTDPSTVVLLLPMP